MKMEFLVSAILGFSFLLLAPALGYLVGKPKLAIWSFAAGICLMAVAGALYLTARIGVPIIIDETVTKIGGVSLSRNCFGQNKVDIALG